MKTLVFGQAGQLAQALAAMAGPHLAVTALGSAQIDLRRPGEARRAIEAIAPDAVVNAAAFTNVDAAEREPEAAAALNADAPQEMAQACAARAIPLVHVSTDYVFDGRKGQAYVEKDAVNPLNVYGRTKAAGEAAVLAEGGAAAVLRTAWVFGPRPANFLFAILDRAQRERVVRVVEEHVNRPTPVEALAEACVLAARRLAREGGAGLWHVAGLEDATRADWAQAALEEARVRFALDAELVRTPASAFPEGAQRPLDTRLDSTAFAMAHGWTIPSWREAVPATVAAWGRLRC